MLKKRFVSSESSEPSEPSGKRKTTATKPKAAAAKKRKPAHFGKLDNNEIETPDNVLKAIRDEFGQFFDPCPFVGKGKRPEFDGTTIEWKQVNYVNPPYDKIEPWCVKAIDETRRGKTVLMLVPVRTGTRYWQRYVFPYADQIRFLTGKIIFKGYTTPSPHHLALIIYLPNYRITQSPPPIRSISTGDVFDSNLMLNDPESRNRYPELAVVCTAHQNAVSAEKSSSDTVAYKKKWAGFQISLKELLSCAESDSEMLEMLHQVCLPVFYQMCCYERATHSEFLTSLETLFADLQQDELERPMPLPVLLSRFKPFLFCNPRLTDSLFRSASVLPSHNNQESGGIDIMLASWFKDAVGFYAAYLDSTHMARAKLTRSYYTIYSDDGEFQQQVVFM